MKSSSTSAASSGGSSKRKPAKPKPRRSLANFPPKLKIPPGCRIVDVQYAPDESESISIDVYVVPGDG